MSGPWTLVEVDGVLHAERLALPWGIVKRIMICYEAAVMATANYIRNYTLRIQGCHLPWRDIKTAEDMMFKLTRWSETCGPSLDRNDTRRVNGTQPYESVAWNAMTHVLRIYDECEKNGHHPDACPKIMIPPRRHQFATTLESAHEEPAKKKVQPRVIRLVAIKRISF